MVHLHGLQRKIGAIQRLLQADGWHSWSIAYLGHVSWHALSPRKVCKENDKPPDTYYLALSVHNAAVSTTLLKMPRRDKIQTYMVAEMVLLTCGNGGCRCSGGT